MSSSTQPLRVGIIGYGLAGAVFHAPLIAATPGLTVSAIVTRDPERAAKARADHPGAEIVTDVEWLWSEAGELDAVVIASPNRSHAPLALEALAAGLPVVIDKPIAVTSEEARRVIYAASCNGQLLTVFQNRRWDGDFLTLRRLLDEGRLGTVVRFESRFERWRPAPKPGWRELGDPGEAGGLLYDLGSHLIDQAIQAFGPASYVYAELDRRRPGVAVDDDAFVALTHESGVRSHLWASVVTAHLAPRFRVLGTKAAYTKYGLDGQEAALRSGAGPAQPGWSEEPESAWGQIDTGSAVERVRTEPGAYLEFYRLLERAIRDGAPVPVDANDSAETLRIIEAARESAASTQVVKLRPDA